MEADITWLMRLVLKMSLPVQSSKTKSNTFSCWMEILKLLSNGSSFVSHDSFCCTVHWWLNSQCWLSAAYWTYSLYSKHDLIILGDPSTHAYDELYCQLTYATLFFWKTGTCTWTLAELSWSPVNGFWRLELCSYELSSAYHVMLYFKWIKPSYKLCKIQGFRLYLSAELGKYNFRNVVWILGDPHSKLHSFCKRSMRKEIN